MQANEWHDGIIETPHMPFVQPLLSVLAGELVEGPPGRVVMFNNEEADGGLQSDCCHKRENHVGAQGIVSEEMAVFVAH